MQPNPSQSKPAQDENAPHTKVWAFRVIAVMLSLLLAETLALGILWRNGRVRVNQQEAAQVSLPTGNVIKRTYPHIDFSTVYPGLAASEVELVQRECFELAYRYEPFTGFGIAPAKKRTVEVTVAGFRAGKASQPWPPTPAANNVFVFGGSTAFGYAVGGQDTLPAALQDEFQRTFPGDRFECYNFGCGFYFSTQERLRFEQFLANGHVPKLAIFVDGLNDFRCVDGLPEFWSVVAKVFPSAEPIQGLELKTKEQAQAAVNSMLERYKANILMIEGVAKQWGVSTLFVGQPVPFYDCPRSDAVYPFPLPFGDHVGASVGYPQYQEQALARKFGSAFIWCGDAFANAQSIMYADSIHYSPEGNRVLARLIVQRAKAQGLLKF